MEEFKNLAILVDLYNYCDKQIKQAKEILRTKDSKEIAKIEKVLKVHITRSPKTFTEYSDEYKQAKKEIEAKYPPIKTKVENYNIAITTEKLSQDKSEIIIQQITTQNKTTLKEMVKLAK